MKKIDIKGLLRKALDLAKKIDISRLRKVRPRELLGRVRISSLRKMDLRKLLLRRQNIFVIFAAIVVILILIHTMSNIHKVLFKKKPSKPTEIVTFEEEGTPVKVFKVKKTEFKDVLPCIGNIKGFNEVDLKFQTSGIMESFNFEEGEKIQEGDIIASLVQKDALLKLKYSEIEMSKNHKLFELGAINQMKLDQAKLEYESAKSELDKTNIYAMSNGLLGSKNMDVGSYVTPNDKVGTFININRVYAEFEIIEKDVPKLALGQRAEVFIDAYPNKSFAGTLDRIAPIIKGRSRTQLVKVEIDNKDGILKPGMFAKALISTYEKKEALVVPASGLKKKEADYFVYVVHKEEPKKESAPAEAAKKKGIWPFIRMEKKEKPKPATKEKEAEFGTVEARKVALGYMTQDLVEIAEGLKEEEVIIIEMQEEFKDKARVEIAEVQEGLF
jgi:membrane fusion protein (multidrug efflux system)